MIFSSIFLHAVTFSHVLHLDVLKSQIGLKLKVKTEISLCMAIMQNNPLPSSTTVLCDYIVHTVSLSCVSQVCAKRKAGSFKVQRSQAEPSYAVLNATGSLC